MNIHLTEEIHKRWLAVQENIQQAATRAHRNAEDIKIIVVTKYQPTERIEAAIQCGIYDFGENYPEMASEKIAYFRNIPQVHWHMIGHLQSRKVAIVANEFSMLHSLDSVKTAYKLEKVLSVNEKILPLLLEVNVSGEESKYGWRVNDATFSLWVEQIREISLLPHLKVIGLMTMPPFFDNPELSRPYFIKLRILLNKLHEQFPILPIDQLSMGTSQDYEVAIEEGATFVRIGTAIMGSRPSE